MNNGDGLRVAVWLSGCKHACYNCQNSQTWNPDSGIFFDKEAEEELFSELDKDYISGLTLTGGDPLCESNLYGVHKIVDKFRERYSHNKTIWLYTGYVWEQIFINSEKEKNDRIKQRIVIQCDVLVDGKYVDSKRDITLQWRGSSNQRVIDIKKSLKENNIILYCN